MRQIKASEVKPGMKVRWESRGFTHEGTVERVTSGTSLYTTRFINGYFGINTPSDATVTVLSEPQPEEPTEFGARVIVDGGTALRTQDAEDEVDPDEGPWRVRSGCNTWDDMTWAEVCALGPVQVVPNQGWTVPETPEVPERIEVWPENDEHLRAYSWWDHDGDTWGWLNDEAEWECRNSADICLGTSRRPVSVYGPWTRITDS